jgi:hypothetical protein
VTDPPTAEPKRRPAGPVVPDGTVAMDLRDVEVWTSHRPSNTDAEFAIVLSDGYGRLDLTASRHGGIATVAGAQRIANAILRFAAGLALFDLPDTESPDSD